VTCTTVIALAVPVVAPRHPVTTGSPAAHGAPDLLLGLTVLLALSALLLALARVVGGQVARRSLSHRFADAVARGDLAQAELHAHRYLDPRTH